MAFIVETGAGTPGATSYVSVEFVTAYLTDMGRETENGWDSISSELKQEACMIASQYVDSRFGPQVKGTRLRDFIAGREATGSIVFTGLPSVNELVTIGQVSYRLVSSLAQENDVLIAATVALTTDNLVAAINSGGTDASVHELTLVNYEAEGEASTDGLTLNVESIAKSVNANLIALSTDVTGATASGATLTGGLDDGPQPLILPRDGMYSYEGRLITGIPLKWKQAVSEYAIRSVASPLDPDPTYDQIGQPVRIKERMEPFESDVSYLPGSGPRIDKPYPAADRLLDEYLIYGMAGMGGTIRS